MGAKMGSFCTHLKIFPTLMHGPEDVEDVLATYGKWLSRLEFQSGEDIVSEVSAIIHHCQQLHTFIWTSVPSSYAGISRERGIVTSLFNECHSLRDVTIKFIWSTTEDVFPWECISSLPSELSRLALYGCPWMPRPPLLGVCLGAVELKHVNYEFCCGVIARQVDFSNFSNFFLLESTVV